MVSKELQKILDSAKNFKELKSIALKLGVERSSYYTKKGGKKWPDYDEKKLLGEMEKILKKKSKDGKKKKSKDGKKKKSKDGKKKSKDGKKKKSKDGKKKSCIDTGCPENKVCNLDTGNCVLKTGKKGKEILAKMEKVEVKTPKVKTPKVKTPKVKTPKKVDIGKELAEMGVERKYQPKSEADKKLLLENLSEIECDVNNPCKEDSKCMITSVSEGKGKCVETKESFEKLLNFSELYPENKNLIKGEVIGTKKALGKLKSNLEKKRKKAMKIIIPKPKAVTPKKPKEGQVIEEKRGDDIEKILKDLKQKEGDDIGDISDTKKEILKCLGIMSL